MRIVQVNWPTLWMSWRERELREILVLPIIVLIMLVPVGAFSGAPAHLLNPLICTVFGIWVQSDRECTSMLSALVWLMRCTIALACAMAESMGQTEPQIFY